MCLIVVIGAFLPRLALFLWWLFGDKLSQVWTNFWLPFAGFIFLPFTTLFYSLAWAPVYVGSGGTIGQGVHGFGWFLVALGFLFDLAHWFGGDRARRSRQADTV